MMIGNQISKMLHSLCVFRKMSENKIKTRKISKWMICSVDIIPFEPWKNHETPGYISELDFCEKYEIAIDRFTRWIMKTPCKRYAGFDVKYNESQLDNGKPLSSQISRSRDYFNFEFIKNTNYLIKKKLRNFFSFYYFSQNGTKSISSFHFSRMCHQGIKQTCHLQM
jgi:hypothetical protein